MGRPLHGDQALFEKLSLEGFQAGLSWITILRKRPRFREAFQGFDSAVVARFGPGDVERLMGDAGIVRNRAKIQATILNAAIVANMSPGEFDRLLWSFAPAPRVDRPMSADQVPTMTPESVALSKELRQRGFRFVGPTTMYALMQSSGMVDDHLNGCWRVSSPDGTSGQPATAFLPVPATGQTSPVTDGPVLAKSSRSSVPEPLALPGPRRLTIEGNGQGRLRRSGRR